LSAWSYWTMCWVSIAALAVAVVGYVDVLIPVHGNHALEGLVALAALWLPAAANFAGTRWVGAVQIVSTILKFVPLLLVAAIGLVPHDKLVDSGAPFADAVDAITGGHWGGTAIALVAVASIVGCLNGWILMAAQMPYAAARDGLFPAPFAKVGKGGVPGFGV